MSVGVGVVVLLDLGVALGLGVSVAVLVGCRVGVLEGVDEGVAEGVKAAVTVAGVAAAVSACAFCPEVGCTATCRGVEDAAQPYKAAVVAETNSTKPVLARSLPRLIVESPLELRCTGRSDMRRTSDLPAFTPDQADGDQC